MPNSIEPLNAIEEAEVVGPHSIRSARGWIVSRGNRFDAEIHRHEYFVLAGALGVLTLFASLIAWRFPFDVDEYLVQKTALAGSPTAIWHLLRTAPLSVDPPLFHFLTYYFLRIFGEREFVLRLPSVLAYTLMTFFLYRFIRRYADVYTGLALVALCLLCGAYPYAYYARPYALWLAASAMTLFCWATLVEERPPRRLALAGLFVGITVAIGSHWFGFMVLAPVLVGESLRTWQRRQADEGLWAVLFAAAGTGLAYLPLVKAAAAYKTLPWKGVALGDISASFQLVLEPCLVPLTLLLVILMVARPMFHVASVGPDQPLSIPAPVLLCVVTFALLPFLVFLVSKVVTHAFQPRYALLCTIGLLVLLALGLREAVSRRPLWMACAVLILSGYALVIQYHTIRGLPAGGDPLAFAEASAFSAEPSLPIVPGMNGYFLRMESHAPPSLRARCVFLSDPDMVRLLHQNTYFLMAEGLRRWTNLPIIDLSSFLRSHPRFYVIQLSCCPSWLVDRLLEDRADISLQGTYDGNPVYLVDIRH
jgi:Dolichyl-phosphate-mannose-protein mannosyltransferase